MAGPAHEPVTLDQMISDTLAMTNFLRGRFGKDKIYLMAHSGGTFIGIQVAARSPELFFAYVGVAQMSNQIKSEGLLMTHAGPFQGDGKYQHGAET